MCNLLDSSSLNFYHPSDNSNLVSNIFTDAPFHQLHSLSNVKFGEIGDGESITFRS